MIALSMLSQPSGPTPPRDSDRDRTVVVSTVIPKSDRGTVDSRKVVGALLPDRSVFETHDLEAFLVADDFEVVRA